MTEIRPIRGNTASLELAKLPYAYNFRQCLEEIFTAVRDTMKIKVDTPRKAESLERFLRPYLECLPDDGTHKLSLRGTGTLCYEPV